MGKKVKGLSLYHELPSLLTKSDIDFLDFRENEKQIVFFTREVQLSLLNEAQLIQQI